MEVIHQLGRSFLKAINAFMEDNCFQYSAAVSFYTLFSLAPVVMICVYVAGIFVGDESVLREFTRYLTEIAGKESAEAVLLLLETVQTNTQNPFYLIISIIFLVISSTTVFIQFKESFNSIFKVVPKPEIGFSKILIDRLMAFGMILILGIAMIISLLMDSMLVSFSGMLLSTFESAQLLMVGVGSNLLTLLMIFLAVLLMFTYLPDVSLRWRPLIAGSLITTFLLIIGKFGVGMIIGNSSLNQLTGASSSIIILMLWVYYSSSIIFFGIELVKALAEAWKGEIEAGRFAKRVRMVEMPEHGKEIEI